MGIENRGIVYVHLATGLMYSPQTRVIMPSDLEVESEVLAGLPNSNFPIIVEATLTQLTKEVQTQEDEGRYGLRITAGRSQVLTDEGFAALADSNRDNGTLKYIQVLDENDQGVVKNGKPVLRPIVFGDPEATSALELNDRALEYLSNMFSATDKEGRTVFYTYEELLALRQNPAQHKEFFRRYQKATQYDDNGKALRTYYAKPGEKADTWVISSELIRFATPAQQPAPAQPQTPTTLVRPSAFVPGEQEPTLLDRAADVGLAALKYSEISLVRRTCLCS